MVHPRFIFASDNMIVPLKSNKTMTGLFCIFLLSIALVGLVNGFLSALNSAETVNRH